MAGTLGFGLPGLLWLGFAGRRVVILNLLEYRDSMVVLDVKQERLRPHLCVERPGDPRAPPDEHCRDQARCAFMAFALQLFDNLDDARALNA